MKKLIISVIMLISVISLPVLSQHSQTVGVNVNCLGLSLMLPDYLVNTDIGSIVAGDPLFGGDPVDVEWTFKGDGTTPWHEVIIQTWEQTQTTGLTNGEYVEIQSHWEADGLTGLADAIFTGPSRFKVHLSKPGPENNPTGCDAEGKIVLKVTGARATEHFPTNRGPVVFTFVIACGAHL